MDISTIETAASAAGIASSYISASGQPVQIAASARQKILDALQTSPTTSVSFLPPVCVFRQGELPRILLQKAVPDTCHWRLQPEQGKPLRGTITHGFLT